VPKLEISFEPGVIVHVSGGKFPGQEEKDHYYLIISEYSKNPANETFVCLPITSWEAEDSFMIKINATDFERGNFARPSQVVCDNIFTFLKTDADSEKGKVTGIFYSKVTKLLKEKILKI
jgi:mRNA-degrading endonuclease toxin of MazEF toxin-antitoxin module